MRRRSGVHPCQDLWDLLRTHGPMLLGAAAQTANGAPSRVEQIKRFAILPVSWEPHGDEVTPHR
jgi:long-subunit acyl-CoA synthetase (AMP-forming)